MAGTLLINKETRKIREVLNLKEIRSGRIKVSLSSASVTDFKKGVKKGLEQRHIEEFKFQLNTLSVELYKFASKDIEAKEGFIENLLDVFDNPVINCLQVYKGIEVFKPNYSLLKWSYYHTVKPNPELIKRYPDFFEQLRFELLLLSSKIKI